MLTPEQLADLRKMAMAATPGPWIVDRERSILAPNGEGSDVTVVYGSMGLDGRRPTSKDAAFITRVNPDIVLQLLDMVVRLEREADWLAQAAANGGMDGWRVSAELWREKARKAVRGDNCEP